VGEGLGAGVGDGVEIGVGAGVAVEPEEAVFAPTPPQPVTIKTSENSKQATSFWPTGSIS
jgi:hypothetical protein